MKLLVNDVSGLESDTPSLNELSSMTQNYDVSEFMVANSQISNIPVKLEDKALFDEKIPLIEEIHSFNFSSNPYQSLSLNTNEADISNATSPQSDIFLEEGTLFNSLLLYQEAIKILTQAIHLNPSNQDAYIERATAYFETNQILLALQDYEKAKKLTIIPPFKLDNDQMLIMKAIYVPENKTEFSKGLLAGTLEGANVSVNEFAPSILNCCRGILNGLWAFVCSPIEISKEMINTAYAIGAFISSHSTEECLQCVVPELKELSLTWDSLNDNVKGQKIGFIIGKYGVDIFAPAGIFKGINKVKALKRANTMCTLESCAASQSKQNKILEISSKRALLREKIVCESAKNGKILIRNANTPFHIMQPKHAWDKIIKVSGNFENDLKNVIKILEDNQIFLEKFRLKKAEEFDKYIRYTHQTKINGHEVKAIFNKNLETGEMFLNDAWVITK